MGLDRDKQKFGEFFGMRAAYLMTAKKWMILGILGIEERIIYREKERRKFGDIHKYDWHLA